MSHSVKIPAEITIPEIPGVPAKRRSLGQLQGQRQLTILESNVKIADPNSNGTNCHCNDEMLDILKSSRQSLEIAFKRWNLRLDQLLDEDVDEAHLAEYKEKWKNVSKKNTDATRLLVKTLTNIKPAGLNTQQNRVEVGPFRPVLNDLKPFVLEKSSTPREFNEWKRRFESYFLGSCLDKAPLKVQQSYFRSCISSQLGNLLDSQISDKLEIFPNPDTPDDNSSCMTLLQTELEARCPLTIRRLALFSTKQAQMSFSDFVALVKKKAETADTFL